MGRLVRAGAARSVAEFVRLAVGEYAKKAGVIRLLNLRDVSVPEARREVEHYLKKLEMTHYARSSAPTSRTMVEVTGNPDQSCVQGSLGVRDLILQERGSR